MANSLSSLNSQLITKNNTETKNIAIIVQSYHINPDDESASYIVGVDSFDKSKTYAVKLADNPKNNSSISGFKNPPTKQGEQDYSVSVNGVIMFEDYKTVPSFTTPSANVPEIEHISAQWARSVVRVKQQNLTLNHTNIRIHSGQDGKDDVVIFDSYNTRHNKVVDVESSKDVMAELEKQILTALDTTPMNESLVLLRIHSNNPNEKPVTSHINAFRHKDTKLASNPKETLDRYKGSEHGKVLLNWIAQQQGNPFKVELTPGCRYYLSPKGKEQFYSAVEKPTGGRIINPSSFLGLMAKNSSYLVKEQDAEGNWVSVSRPRAMELFLFTTELTDKTRIVTGLKVKTSKTPFLDLAALPSNAKAKPLENVIEAEHVVQTQEDISESISEPANNGDDEFAVELSEADLAALSDFATFQNKM
ncbi:hypothetical protein OCF84_20615 (plasmid) [Shewanella xiamenensis]|uniref:Uncharacterized protein n=1 Tax=Shewanella xiamenensis TaxID=332186 RepID=A0ABT6UFT5_9GAMM|nr:hypothetical protein [Shewanella xiamenensis]MDI5833327.1 hypothetical protein [Shewanella xiamenensis]WHF57921.1 hypothetical protein OCF84_20615 [Shewanella xiamenensis]